MKHSLFYAYCRKWLQSPMTYCCIAGIAGISMFRYLSTPIGNPDVVYLFDLLLDLDAFRKVIPFLSAIPFAANYCNEYNNGIANFSCFRSGTECYIRTNFLMNLLSAFLVTFLGLFLFVGICAVQMPLYTDIGNPTTPPYGIFLDMGVPILYLLIKSVLYSASIAMWTSCGVAFSAFLPNPYIAICSPFVFTYVLEQMTLYLPDPFNLWYLSLGRDVLGGGSHLMAWVTCFYTLGIFLILTLIAGHLFTFGARRRIQNELS